jgi:acyl-CoA reductase-like NAD-dependent aldehyde dehydrogenase
MTLQIQSFDETVAPFVDGKLAGSARESTVPVINPSNGKVCSFIPTGCKEDAERAVASARRAFDDGRWCEISPSARKAILHRLANLIDADAETLDVFDATEMGKPVRMSYGNAASGARLMRFYAEAVDKLMGDTYGSDRNSFVVQRRVPRGVVAAVTPWNFPVVNVVRKVAPALAAGNCVVLKPSELASRSALHVAHLALRAGVPPGVFNVVPGLGETVGQALGLHMGVDMLAFTGSTQVGRWMMQYAGQSNLKVVLAECGGKSPQIVFDDGVDLDSASDQIARQLLTNQGQICSVGSRLLVQRSIEARVIERIVARLREIVIGDALDPATTFGPLVSAQQCARVMGYIDTAESEGAQLAFGGRRVLGDSGGFFVEPTVFRRVSPQARIAQEEIFGPVLAVMTFNDEAEAIRIANGTIYGLAAYAWTADLSRGMRLMKHIRSSIWINAAAPSGEGAGHAAAYEPLGQSGIGTEGGVAGAESYLRRQLVCIHHA